MVAVRVRGRRRDGGTGFGLRPFGEVENPPSVARRRVRLRYRPCGYGELPRGYGEKSRVTGRLFAIFQLLFVSDFFPLPVTHRSEGQKRAVDSERPSVEGAADSE